MRLIMVCAGLFAAAGYRCGCCAVYMRGGMPACIGGRTGPQKTMLRSVDEYDPRLNSAFAPSPPLCSVLFRSVLSTLPPRVWGILCVWIV